MEANWLAEEARAVASNAPPTRLREIEVIRMQIAEILNQYDPVKNPDNFVIDKKGLFDDPALS